MTEFEGKPFGVAPAAEVVCTLVHPCPGLDVRTPAALLRADTDRGIFVDLEDAFVVKECPCLGAKDRLELVRGGLCGLPDDLGQTVDGLRGDVHDGGVFGAGFDGEGGEVGDRERVEDGAEDGAIWHGESDHVEGEGLLVGSARHRSARG
jgi:hypothetical protein